MRKLLLTLGILLIGTSSFAYSPITPDSYITPDDVTIARLQGNQNIIVNAINNFDGGNIKYGSISADQLNADTNPHNRWNEAFNDFVYTGLLPVTSASLTTSTSAGIAYIEGIRLEKEATNHTYDASQWTFVDISKNGTFTYSPVAIKGATPAIATSSIRLARVSTDGTTVFTVRDDRVLAISLAIEDQYRNGLSISVISPDTLTISPGVVYVGNTRITKVSKTALAVGTATDWAMEISGSGRAVSTKGYVVVNSAGTIALTTIAPTTSDTSGNSDGELRYSVINSVYWRVIDWFYMDASDSGNVENYYHAGAWKDSALSGDVLQVVSSVSYDSQSISSGVMFGTTGIPADTTIPQISEGDLYLQGSIVPSNAENLLKIDVCVQGSNTTSARWLTALFQDAGTNALAANQITPSLNSVMNGIYFTHIQKAGTTGKTLFTVRCGNKATDGGTFTINGVDSTMWLGGAIKSRLVITEIKD